MHDSGQYLRARMRRGAPRGDDATALFAPQAGSAMFRPADPDSPPRVAVVAEIGVNHDGDPDRARMLIEAAAEAGADGVKFQLFEPDHLLSQQAALADYQAAQHETDVKEMLRRLQLGPDQLAPLARFARAAGLSFVVTPFSLQEVEAAAGLEIDAVKVASPDAVNRPLLQAAAALGKPLLVSTGTAELEELSYVAGLIGSHASGGCLLQCVSAYPTPPEQASLGGVTAIAQRYGLPVGYSDHTQWVFTGALAVAAGACVVEKHLTYDRGAAGPDHAASLEPGQFAEYVAHVRRAAQMYTALGKSVRPIEQEVRRLCRQSVCLVCDLPAGHVLRRRDLTVKRPGTGIPAAELDQVIGKRLRYDLRGDRLLQRDDLS